MRLSMPVIELLHEFDIRCIGQVLKLPRAELPSRFGPELLLRLDQALGSLPELLTPERPVEIIEATQVFEPPIADRQILDSVLDQLLQEILARLHPFQLGVLRLRVGLKITLHEPLSFAVELLRPTHSQHHLTELLRLHVERLTIPAEVTAVALQAEKVAPLECHQQEMFAGDGADQWREVTTLIERLSSRLGEKAVLRPVLQAEAQPEFACRYEAAILSPSPPASGGEGWGEGGENGAIVGYSQSISSASMERGEKGRALQAFRIPHSAFRISSVRPPCLQSRPTTVSVISLFPGGAPLRFDWDDQPYIIARCWGPERIETGWWRGDDIRRDYFLVETNSGERFWLFRSLVDEAWFLHGVFG
jgi:protein ImuB